MQENIFEIIFHVPSRVWYNLLIRIHQTLTRYCSWPCLFVILWDLGMQIRREESFFSWVQQCMLILNNSILLKNRISCLSQPKIRLGIIIAYCLMQAQSTCKLKNCCHFSIETWMRESCIYCHTYIIIRLWHIICIACLKYNINNINIV